MRSIGESFEQSPPMIEASLYDTTFSLHKKRNLDNPIENMYNENEKIL